MLWPNDRPFRVRLNQWHEHRNHPLLVEADRQLTEYFAGERTEFTLPLHAEGTPFQTRVWQCLLTIPYGRTRTYGELARAIQKGSAARAVGLAASKNPLSIVVPCHRVLGASGSLTGFAGGLEIKARLLALEGARGAEPVALGKGRKAYPKLERGADYIP